MILPCLPFLFWASFQQFLSHKWASYRPVHRCLKTNRPGAGHPPSKWKQTTKNMIKMHDNSPGNAPKNGASPGRKVSGNTLPSPFLHLPHTAAATIVNYVTIATISSVFQGLLLWGPGHEKISYRGKIKIKMGCKNLERERGI